MHIEIKLNEPRTKITLSCYEKPKGVLRWVLAGTTGGKIISGCKKGSPDEKLRLRAAFLALKENSDSKQLIPYLALPYPRWAEFVVNAENASIKEAMANSPFTL